jgi:hypothetical protein
MGEHVLPRDITVYQAVQQFGGQVRSPTPISVSMTKIVTVNGVVADSHHFKADPDHPDPAFHFIADLDPAPHQCDANLRPLVYRPASIVGVHGSILSI